MGKLPPPPTPTPFELARPPLPLPPLPTPAERPLAGLMSEEPGAGNEARNEVGTGRVRFSKGLTVLLDKSFGVVISLQRHNEQIEIRSGAKRKKRVRRDVHEDWSTYKDGYLRSLMDPAAAES